MNLLIGFGIGLIIADITALTVSMVKTNKIIEELIKRNNENSKKGL